MIRVLALWLIFFVLTSNAWGQSGSDLVLRKSEVNRSLEDCFLALESRLPIRFFYLKPWIGDFFVSAEWEGKPLPLVLDELFLGTDLIYAQPHGAAFILIKDPTQALKKRALLEKTMAEQKSIESVNLGQKLGGRVTKISISGVVRDGKSNEALVGVSVRVPELEQNAVTDAGGRFSLTVPTGEYLLILNYVNYEEKVLSINAYEAGEFVVVMEETPTVLEEIVVQAGKDMTGNNLGQIQLSVRDIKRAPTLLGEADLIRQIQTMPGVTTVGEAASGFNVRGGSVDQNLILYDGLQVFNSSHMFGFFSVFNTEAIRDVNFYRGAVPAEFGGRSSSVLDIRSKEGNYNNWEFSGGIGIISSNLMASGPIVKNKTSVAASIRTTYSDWLLNTVRSNYLSLENSSVTFYDGSLKIGHIFNEKTKLVASGYLSHDRFRLQGDSTFQWDTRMASVRLDHDFNKKLSGFIFAGIGTYSYDVSDEGVSSGFNLRYAITHPTFKVDFLYQPGQHKVSFGGQMIDYQFQPGELIPVSGQSIVRPVKMDTQRSQEWAAYLTDDFEIMQGLHLNAGLRVSWFRSMGPGTVYTYAPNEPRSPVTVQDSVVYGKGDEIAAYWALEPRVGLRVDVAPGSAFKLGFNRMYQYLHLVTNTTAITPIDIWQPSGYYFKPQYADQLTLGFNRAFRDRKYEWIVEGYYKKMYNVLDFKDGAQLILNPRLETDLLQGDGRAYGVEFQLSKLAGRLTGNVSYTFSRSFRTISSVFPEEQINDGKEYPSNFDQPHVVNLSWKYNLSRRIFFTGNFTYRTGRPITLPVTAFSIENFTVSAFSERNEFRIPDYHRLDLAMVVEGSHKRKKFWDGTWTFSFYNVYGRKNPYSIFFKEVIPGILRPYQLAIIGTVVPSISYSFKI